MKLCVKLIGVVVVFLISTQTMANSWSSWFPTNKPLKAKVMNLVQSKEELEIAKKLQAGLASHQQWLINYVKDLKPGQEMPYHVNFGISKTEYHKYIRMIAHQKLSQTSTVDVQFIQEKNGAIKIKTRQNSPINGLVVTQKSVNTPFGQTTLFSEINNTDRASATGPWQGVQWSLFDFDEQLVKKQDVSEVKGKEVKLAVGKLTKTGEGILYYTAKDIDMPKGKNVQVSYVIYYPLVK